MFLMATLDPRAQLVNAALTRNGLSMRWLASRVETSHVSVGQWLSGTARPRDQGVWRRMLAVLADYERDAQGQPGVSVERLGLRQIPVYPGLSAGVPNTLQSDVSMIEMKDWGSTNERWGRIVDGSSMEPYLLPGDIAVFEDRQWEPNHVVHVYDGGTDSVKIARGRGNSAQLVPANPHYDPIPAAGMNIRGVCVARIRKGPNSEVTTTEYPYGMRIADDGSRVP